MKLAWHSKPNPLTPSILTSVTNSSTPSTNASNVNLTEKNKVKETGLIIATFAAEEKAVLDAADAPPPSERSAGRKWKWFGAKDSSKVTDVEKGAKRPRPVRLFAPLFVGAGTGLAVCES